MTPFMRWAVFLKKEMLPLLKRSGVVVTISIQV